MRLFAIAAMLFIGTLVFNAESTFAHAQPNENKASQTQNKKQSTKITVKTGDTLSKIANKQDTTYLRIFYANKKIKDPDVIYPGDKMRIPAKNEKLKKRPLYKPVQKTTVYTPKRQASVHTNTSAPAPVYSNNGGVWDRLAQCESGGNWSINTGNGYYGGLQFSAASWQAAGGRGLPHQASKADQIERAKVLQSSQGWGAWPACSSKLGIR